MRYVLAQFVGDGQSYATAFRPDVPDEPFDMIDLRPDRTRVDGFCVVALRERTTALPQQAGRIDLGNANAKTSIGVGVRNALGNVLGHAFATNKTGLGDVLGDIMLAGKSDGSTWMPLAPTGVADNVYEIFLGNESIWSMTVPAGGAVSVDAFTRANNTTLGGSWAEFGGNLEISTNAIRCVVGSHGSENRAIYDVDCGSGDMYAQMTSTYVANFGNACLLLRGNSAHTSYVELRVNQTGRKCEVVKRVLGTTTSIRAGTNNEFGTWGVGTSRTIRIEGEGSSYRIKNNGTQVVTFTDTDNVLLQRGGLGVSYLSVNTDFTVDNFEQGMLDEGNALWRARVGRVAVQRASRW